MFRLVFENTSCHIGIYNPIFVFYKTFLETIFACAPQSRDKHSCKQRPLPGRQGRAFTPLPTLAHPAYASCIPRPSFSWFVVLGWNPMQAL